MQGATAFSQIFSVKLDQLLLRCVLPIFQKKTRILEKNSCIWQEEEGNYSLGVKFFKLVEAWC